MASLKTKTVDNVFVIYFTDASIIDDQRMDELSKELDALLNEAATDKFLLSFRGVEFMGSAMIGKIIQFRSRCEKAEVKLHFSNVCDNIMTAITVLRLHKSWKIHADEDKAIKALNKKGLF